MTQALATAEQLADKVELTFVLHETATRDQWPYQRTDLVFKARVEPIGGVAVADGTIKLKLLSAPGLAPSHRGTRYKVTIEKLPS